MSTLLMDVDGSGLSLLLLLYVMFVGACLGSFVNVVVSRLPQGLSIVRPSSRCPSCATPIRWYDNIPILSYLLLRGHCRTCKVTISPRYVIIEGVMMVLAAALALRFGWSVELLRWMVLTPALLAIVFIDIDHWYIPDVITLPAFVWIIATALWPFHLDALVFVLWGLLPAALLWLVAMGFAWLTGREGLGLGDVKLLAVLGAAIGLPGGLVVLFLSSVQGAVIGTLVVWRGGHRGIVSATNAKIHGNIHAGNHGHNHDDHPDHNHDDHRDHNYDDPRDHNHDDTYGDDDHWIPPPNAVPFGPFLVLATLEYILLPDLFAQFPHQAARWVLEVLH